MNKQKGQSTFEFAIVLPFFLLLIFCLIYIGMAMADYLSLSSIARSSAREAAIIQVENEVNSNYSDMKKKYYNYTLPMDIYTWNPRETSDFDIEYKKHNVVVTINARLNENGFILANIVNKLADSTNSNFDLHITYTMYSEYTQK